MRTIIVFLIVFLGKFTDYEFTTLDGVIILLLAAIAFIGDIMETIRKQKQ